MITEDYVSFGTAKLLKEKGFDEKCYANYSSNGVALHFNYQTPSDGISCPTLQMAMKWLREVHKLIISPKYDEAEDEKELLYSMWFFDILPISKTLPVVEHNQGYDTYEQAVEEAIKYALENLI